MLARPTLSPAWAVSLAPLHPQAGRPVHRAQGVRWAPAAQPGQWALAAQWTRVDWPAHQHWWRSRRGRKGWYIRYRRRSGRGRTGRGQGHRRHDGIRWNDQIRWQQGRQRLVASMLRLTSRPRTEAGESTGRPMPEPRMRRRPRRRRSPDAPVVWRPDMRHLLCLWKRAGRERLSNCTCNPPPCPSMPCPSCAYGYVRDSNGCLTCTCAPDPSVPCSQILDLRVCEAHSHCRWLTPGCAMGANPLAQSESGCYEQVDCLTTSDCTETGSTCVDRTVAPPGGPGGDWCGMAVRICL